MNDPVFLEYGALGLLGLFLTIVLTNLVKEVRRQSERQHQIIVELLSEIKEELKRNREAMQELTLAIREVKILIERVRRNG